MIRLIDTSYIIVFDKKEKRLTAYYDFRGKLDNHSSLMSNLATVGNYGCIANLFDMSKETKPFFLSQSLFKGVVSSYICNIMFFHPRFVKLPVLR